MGLILQSLPPKGSSKNLLQPAASQQPGSGSTGVKSPRGRLCAKAFACRTLDCISCASVHPLWLVPRQSEWFDLASHAYDHGSPLMMNTNGPYGLGLIDVLFKPSWKFRLRLWRLETLCRNRASMAYQLSAQSRNLQVQRPKQFQTTKQASAADIPCSINRSARTSCAMPSTSMSTVSCTEHL